VKRTELEPQKAWPTMPGVVQLHYREHGHDGAINEMLAREGQGDIRVVGWRRQEDGTYRHEIAYRPRTRNGMPGRVPYVYGASRGGRAWQNLDLAAITQADLESDGRRRNKPLYRPVAERSSLPLRDMSRKLRRVAAEGRSPEPDHDLWRRAVPRRASDRRAAVGAVTAKRSVRRMRPADVSRVRNGAEREAS